MLDEFSEIWCVDFEFYAPNGEQQTPLCMVAREYRTRTILRLWRDDLQRLSRAPFNVGPNSLFVAYYASAEMGCFLSLNWPMPTRVLDLYVEFCRCTNGCPTPSGRQLVGALIYFGLDHIGVEEKSEMRELAMRGGDYTAEERRGLLAYCQSDVDALIRLLPRMVPHFDNVGRMCLRGRYMKAAACIEHAGIPIDVPTLRSLRTHWSQIQLQLITRIDRSYGIYDGAHFKLERFADFLAHRAIPWPLTDTGRLSTKNDIFREMAKIYPEIAPLHELRATLGQLRLNDLAVGNDGRNRTLLSAFQAKSSRNAPSSKKFIFGPAVWIRALIKPDPGYAVAYLDWSSEEFGIGAVLSGDQAMIDAYTSGDPYLTFAKQVGAFPADGTRQTHGSIRDLFKTVCLGINYGMGAISLSGRIGRPPVEARYLLQLHRETYRNFWRWSDGAVDHAMTLGSLHTVFGWALRTGADANPRSLRNFPLQANGAEMLRLACCLATESGVRVIAPVHDALLIEAPVDQIQQHIMMAELAMRRASSYVLDGFELRVDRKLVVYPGRFMDERGQVMWSTVGSIVGELKRSANASTYAQV
jgi:hypothetical protein